MTDGDFFSTEQSITTDAADAVSIVYTSASGEKQPLKEGIKLQAG